jgi:hypothetical protein
MFPMNHSTSQIVHTGNYLLDDIGEGGDWEFKVIGSQVFI